MKITHEKLKDIIKLEQKKYRKLNNKYLVFGKHIVMEALEKNKVYEILTTDETLANYFETFNVDVYLITNKQKEKFKSLKSIPNIIGVCEKTSTNVNLITSNIILGINKINNPDNLGSILRSARAFGIKDVILDFDTADLYNSKTVQAMQGVNFSLNIVEADLYKTCEKYLGRNYKIITTFLDEPNEFINEISTKEETNNYIIILGNEAQGIEDKYKQLEHINFKLNIVYESLNVAHAGSIIMYEISKNQVEKG